MFLRVFIGPFSTLLWFILNAYGFLGMEVLFLAQLLIDKPIFFCSGTGKRRLAIALLSPMNSKRKESPRLPGEKQSYTAITTVSANYRLRRIHFS